MGLLGDATVVSAQVGRKLNNALTVTFKTSADQTVATAVQAGSLGVLLGFRNGGGGKYKVDDELVVECAGSRTQLKGANGDVVGSVEKDAGGDGLVRLADGTVAARVMGQPNEGKGDPAWSHALVDGQGQPLGQLTWLRTKGTIDVVGELDDLYIWWDRAGESLKVPSLGAHLALDHPVDGKVGDLLMATCVDMTVGSHSFVRA